MDTEVKDVECPTEPSPTVATDETESSVTETSSPPPTPSKRAPSPPRWRFVNEAKSTLGYSSLSAGRVVSGKSAEELGAKYIPPDVSLYTPKEEKKEVGKLEIVTSKEEVEEELPDAKFPGLPAKEEPETNEPRKLRVWDQTYDVAPKQIKDFVWFDGEVDDRYKVGDVSSVEDRRNVGKLQPRSSAYVQDNLNGQCVMPKKDDTLEKNSDHCWQLAIDSAWQLSTKVPEKDVVLPPETAYETLSTSSSHEKEPPPIASPEVYHDEPKDEEKHDSNFYETKRCRYLSLLLLLLLSIILLGVLLSSRSRGTTNDAVAAAMVAVVATNSTYVPSYTPSASPSVIPSALPSDVPSSGCPVGEKAFFLDHSIPNMSSDRHNATWELRDSCSAELVLACLPCSLGTVVLGNRNGRNMQIEILQPLSQCIPSGREYSFHVYSTDNPDSCCGFDADSFYIRYNNEQYSIADFVLFPYPDDINFTIVLGENEKPCGLSTAQIETSSSPSLWPTFDLTSEPSDSPTNKPTTSPTKLPSSPPTPSPVSKSPVTNSPTKQPLGFVGGCPEQFVPLSYYALGTQVESGGIVYECINYSCGTYGFEPGKENSTLWQQGWAVKGTCDGTLTPTSRPTVRVTSSPTEFPTMKPALCTTKADFNLCLALDNSGSICGFGIDDCLFCEPALFCSNLFSFLPPDTCCNNYADIIEFSKLMVLALDQFDAEKSFSVVQFATNAQLISNLATANDALDVLDNVRYTGGSTDFSDPIRLCQQSFESSSDPGRRNFIMLITDGLPATTTPDPVLVAQEEADIAKNNGTFIIPIFISEYNDPYALAFMSALSSDGQVFDVTGFASLDTLKDRLIEQVSCS
ncbi:hypothetical protein HJC23_005125 [Cyclotella cryptica]|uniref:VWFA domain-containing protein n=1 Tax=Cyclotella cryptica TaxID=29204 RepID=A0ABD3QHF2_9STRA|eukprot:CCRYP_005822-RA/>CCRYP_005822-RA protein AED:0.15 eAED:0.15 QI:0/-1/0/1/-1/1/1/0/856